MTVTYRTIIRIVWALCLLGIALGALGLHAAYQQVGFHSTAGHIITIAIVVEGTLAGCALFFGRRLAARRRR